MARNKRESSSGSMGCVMGIVIIILLIAFLGKFLGGLGLGSGKGDGDGEGTKTHTEQNEDKKEESSDEDKEFIQITIVKKEYFYENERISLKDFIKILEDMDKTNLVVQIKEDSASLNAYNNLIDALDELHIEYIDE